MRNNDSDNLNSGGNIPMRDSSPSISQSLNQIENLALVVLEGISNSVGETENADMIVNDTTENLLVLMILLTLVNLLVLMIVLPVLAWTLIRYPITIIILWVEVVYPHQTYYRESKFCLSFR